MSALARAGEGPDRADPASASGGMSGILAEAARRHPDRPAFADEPGREVWSGRPPAAWTYAHAHRIVERLATVLGGLSLAPGTPVGICLPNGSEACLSILAVERAGHVPCLLPVGWSEEAIGEAIESVQAAALICQTRVAEERPAEAFCRLAARYFGLRFVAAFGPRVPDGVIDLDRAILDTAAALPPPGQEGNPGLVTFEGRDGSRVPLFRPSGSALSAAMHFLAVGNFSLGDRIVGLLPPDDHRSLTTGFLAALLSGAAYEAVGLFDAASLASLLAADRPAHLVAPAFLERELSAAALPGILSTVLVHEAPLRFEVRRDLSGPVIDVLALGERACLSRPRGTLGHLAFALEDDGDRRDSGHPLLRVRRDEEGGIAFAGPAAEVYPFRRGRPVLAAKLPEWHRSGFAADVFAGVAIGVR